MGHDNFSVIVTLIGAALLVGFLFYRARRDPELRQAPSPTFFLAWWLGPRALMMYWLSGGQVWKCVECDKKNRSADNYCTGCGAADPALCQVCKMKSYPPSRYCPKCGSDRSPGRPPIIHRTA